MLTAKSPTRGVEVMTAEAAGEGSGPMNCVDATAPPQYHMTGWSAVMPPPIET